MASFIYEADRNLCLQALRTAHPNTEYSIWESYNTDCLIPTERTVY